MIERIESLWTGHRILVVAIGAIAIVAVVGTGLLISLAPGRSSPESSPSPSESSSLIASESPSASPTENPSPSLETGPTALPSGWAYADLDGVAAPSDLANRLPIAVMVDDNRVARPQSGFTSASIVYQAPADGGEDRYMLVFQEATASDIGPVRSARPYYVYWAAEYKAGFGHYGGDITSLQEAIPAMARYIYNMDALNGDACPYHRVSTRAAPHNAYTNSAVLISCAAKIGQPAKYQGVPVRTFVDDSPVADRGTQEHVAIPYRTGSVGYEFDPQTDSYLRSVDGKLQTDPANNQQVVARNVIVLFQALTYDSASDPGHNRPVIASVGTGKALVFKEGHAIVATWKKPTKDALTRLYDSSGNEISLVRGQIFVQCVPTGTAVAYS